MAEIGEGERMKERGGENMTLTSFKIMKPYEKNLKISFYWSSTLADTLYQIIGHSV